MANRGAVELASSKLFSLMMYFYRAARVASMESRVGRFFSDTNTLSPKTGRFHNLAARPDSSASSCFCGTWNPNV